MSVEREVTAVEPNFPLSRICNSARNTGQFAIADCRIANPAVFRAAIQLPLNAGVSVLSNIFIVSKLNDDR
jgi:hypothetical protein